VYFPNQLSITGVDFLEKQLRIHGEDVREGDENLS
jgi:hypothetical protein